MRAPRVGRNVALSEAPVVHLTGAVELRTEHLLCRWACLRWAAQNEASSLSSIWRPPTRARTGSAQRQRVYGASSHCYKNSRSQPSLSCCSRSDYHRALGVAVEIRAPGNEKAERTTANVVRGGASCNFQPHKCSGSLNELRPLSVLIIVQ